MSKNKSVKSKIYLKISIKPRIECDSCSKVVRCKYVVAHTNSVLCSDCVNALIKNWEGFNEQ